MTLDRERKRDLNSQALEGGWGGGVATTGLHAPDKVPPPLLVVQSSTRLTIQRSKERSGFLRRHHPSGLHRDGCAHRRTSPTSKPRTRSPIPSTSLP